MPNDLEQLLRGLNSRNRQTQNQAVRQAKSLVPERMESLLQLADMEIKSFQARQQSGTYVVLIVLAVFTFVMWLAKNSLSPAVFMYGLGVVSAALAIWLETYLPLRARKNLHKIVAEVDDPRFVGAALTMLVPDRIGGSTAYFQLPGNPTRTSILSALKRMLPHLRADHKVVLTKEQMQALLLLLEHPLHDPALTRAILKALQQIGDEKTVFAVRRVIVQTRTRPSLHQEAQECLMFLMQRVQEQHQAQTLLRASQAGENILAEALLRPASAAVEDSAEKLLRPIN